MKKYFFMSFVILWASTGHALTSPEQYFLKQLRALDSQYEKGKINFTSNLKKNNNPEKEKITYQYYLNMPKLWVLLQTFCYTSLKFDNPFPLKGKMRNYQQKNKALSPKDLLNFFEPKIKSGKFNIQNGDIVMILPHEMSSYIRAYTLNSAYSHQDMIYINKLGIPKVITISPNHVAIVDLADYILGVGVKNSYFAIYRYNKEIDTDKLKVILKKIESNFNNLFFDEPFQRNTEIESIETFLNSPRFFYCGELIFAVYSHVLGHSNFINKDYVTIRDMFKYRGVNITPLNEYLIKYAEKMERENNQWIIDPQNFYLSKNFSPVVIYKNSVSIQKTINNE